MKAWFAKTAAMQRDSLALHRFYVVLAVLLALTQFACALGSGNPATAEPLPDAVNIAANVLAVLIGLLVLLPRTRAAGAALAALNMAASMSTNYRIDGYAYFLKVLPFDAASLVLALLLVWHYRQDLLQPLRSTL